jgi:hypothetical protein
VCVYVKGGPGKTSSRAARSSTQPGNRQLGGKTNTRIR